MLRDCSIKSGLSFPHRQVSFPWAAKALQDPAGCFRPQTEPQNKVDACLH